LVPLFNAWRAYRQLNSSVRQCHLLCTGQRHFPTVSKAIRTLLAGIVTRFSWFVLRAGLILPGFQIFDHLTAKQVIRGSNSFGRASLFKGFREIEEAL
jgi:hypothetical protein